MKLEDLDVEPQSEDDTADKQGDDDRSTSDILVDLAEALYQFGVTDDGETYGVPKKGPKVALLLRGGKTSLRAQLSAQYRKARRKTPPQQAIANAMLCIEGIAQEAEPAPLHQRVATHDGSLWLDLGDHTGRAVRVDTNSWAVVDQAPVLFKRTALTGALPEPAHGATLDELWSWLNVTPDDRPLIAAALVSTLYPNIPHPVIGLTGEQGTGKTTATRVLVDLLDPSPVPYRKVPKDAEAWVTAAGGSWVVGLDNLGYIPSWLSDSICRAVTGTGDVRRRLYTDGDLAVFAFRRVIIANGIDFGALRGDLAERMLPIELDVIDDTARKEEEDYWPRWAQVHPRILAAVLDLAHEVHRTLPSVTLARRPRMADFARILATVDGVLGTAGLARYLAKQDALAADSLTGDTFITAIGSLIGAGTWTGTSAELLDKMSPTGERLPKGWPADPRAVTTRLRRQAAPMRKTGWTVTDDGGRNMHNAARWNLTPPRRGEWREARNSASYGSSASSDHEPHEDTSHTSQESGPLSTGGASSCRVCGEPIDPVAGTIHPGCEETAETPE